MQRSFRCSMGTVLIWAAFAGATITGSARSAAAQAVPPAPIPYFWPERAFEPARQCSGAYAVADLERFLPLANIALQIPSAEQVTLDSARHCIKIAVRGIGTGRLVELVLRGMGVPRRAVLLELREPTSLRHG